MEYKKLVLSGILTLGVFMGSVGYAAAQNVSYTVQPGDTFWSIGQKYGISTSNLMKANNATSSTILYPGNILTVPLPDQTTYTVVSGDTYWTISQKFGVSFTKLLQVNNATDKSWLNIGDKVIIPASSASTTPAPSPDPTQTPSSGQTSGTGSAAGQTTPYLTYDSYTVKAGDTVWSIANSHNIPMNELMSANNFTSTTWLTIGQVIKIPVHNIPVKPTPGDRYGEYLDWWTEAQYVVPVNSVFEVVDFYTGKSFFAKRTTGSNHADCETLTQEDTQKMKDIWGGTLSWDRRPVVIKINGRKIAASVASMPHAGNDAAPGGSYTTWRSGGYGPGDNLDWVKNNGIDGVFDIHFLNSTRHVDGQIDPGHQANIKIAAGIN
ncbi:MAG TPA: LysM peptidoglycan-binding domain-containing protein [Clostridia bacterium]|nr:LysM peptidoglycan-binding domain-containing protein [Clostridia bacterium]